MIGAIAVGLLLGLAAAPVFRSLRSPRRRHNGGERVVLFVERADGDRRADIGPALERIQRRWN